MNDPLISIVVPAYNYGHLILETLKSVSAQTYVHWECIIVDDGSTDNTAVVVQDFIRLHPKQNFKYIFVSNSGLSAARNSGIMHANGSYMQFLDADDLLSKDKLSVQVCILKSQDCALVYSEAFFFNHIEGQESIVHKYPSGYLAQENLSGNELLNRIIKNNLFPVSSPLVCTELVTKAGKFSSSLSSNEDWLFWFNIALLKPNFIFDATASSFTKIRVHRTSMMNNHQRMFLSEVNLRQQIEVKLGQLPDTPEINSLKRSNLDFLALHQVSSLKVADGMTYILTNFVENPFQNIPLFCEGYYRLMVRTLKKMAGKRW